MDKSSSPLPPSAGFTAAEIAAMEQARESASSGNPTVARRALLSQPIRVGDHVVPVLTMAKVLLLEEIGSPLAKPGGKPTNEQVFEALYCITQPVADVLALWSRGDKAAWRTAVYAFADTIPASSAADMAIALAQQIADAESTVIGSETSLSASSDETGAASGEKKTPSVAPVNPESPPPNPTA